MAGVGGPKAEPLPGEVCKASSIVVGDLVHLISAGFLTSFAYAGVGILHSSLFLKIRWPGTSLKEAREEGEHGGERMAVIKGKKEGRRE